VQKQNDIICKNVNRVISNRLISNNVSGQSLAHENCGIQLPEIFILGKKSDKWFSVAGIVELDSQLAASQISKATLSCFFMTRLIRNARWKIFI